MIECGVCENSLSFLVFPTENGTSIFYFSLAIKASIFLIKVKFIRIFKISMPPISTLSALLYLLVSSIIAPSCLFEIVSNSWIILSVNNTIHDYINVNLKIKISIDS